MEVEEGLEESERTGVREDVPASGRSEPIVIIQTHEEIVMAFGKNHAELVGRFGADVVVNHLASGGRVANMSIATDESFLLRSRAGEKVDRTEWHRVVTFQDGLIDMLERHAKKGRLIHVEGKMQTRRWRKDGEDSDRFSTEIIVVPGHRVQFYDRPNGNGATEPAGGEAMPAGGAPAQADDFGSEEVPF